MCKPRSTERVIRIASSLRSVVGKPVQGGSDGFEGNENRLFLLWAEVWSHRVIKDQAVVRWVPHPSQFRALGESHGSSLKGECSQNSQRPGTWSGWLQVQWMSGKELILCDPVVRGSS